jgi:NADPH:quinone reductase-like Zn-dependent oxidoreductase
MKAVILPQYGSPDVLQYRDVEEPDLKSNEVLIRVHASSVNAGDWHLMRADPFLIRLMYGLTKPRVRIPGSDLAGVIEKVGLSVTRFKPGDEVFGEVSGKDFGAFAEYVTAEEDMIAHKPENLSMEEAAAVPVAGLTALQALRDKGKLSTGDHVLVNGASGGVGSFAVQIARSRGAEVTAVCSKRKWEFVRSLGPNKMINYQEEDFTQSGKTYDLILAANGYHPIRAYKRCLKPKGRYVMTGGDFRQMMQAMIWGPILSKKEGQQLGFAMQQTSHKDLVILKGMLEKLQIRPHIDQTFSLQNVPDAIRYLETGQPKGKLVIALHPPIQF